MKLQKQNHLNPDLELLQDTVKRMEALLDESQDSDLTIEELCSFQSSDGSFTLLDSYRVPGDAREDFCHMPTYIGAAILMKEYLNGKEWLSIKLDVALKASLKGGLCGHGYDEENGRIEAMRIFIKGGLREFLENKRDICPEFQQGVYNIVHSYNSRLLRGFTKGAWGEDYRDKWQEIVDSLIINKRLYAAYGSNMEEKRMNWRCKRAVPIGKTYLQGWELTLPHYANIERTDGKKTPARIWEITPEDEKSLNRYEGYPDKYAKTEIIVEVNGIFVTAMAYVMTDEYKNKEIVARDNYVDDVIQGYRDAGFKEEEFSPKRG